MSVEPATLSDVPAIVSLEQLCLGADAWSEPLVAEGVEGRLPTVDYLVLRSDGVVRGYAVASYVGDVAELQRIGVHPDARRGGLGSVLVDEVIDRARAVGVERVLLEVREDNASALAFYTELGFTELDRRPRYYRDGSTAVVLVLELSGTMSR